MPSRTPMIVAYLGFVFLDFNCVFL